MNSSKKKQQKLIIRFYSSKGRFRLFYLLRLVFFWIIYISYSQEKLDAFPPPQTSKDLSSNKKQPLNQKPIKQFSDFLSLDQLKLIFNKSSHLKQVSGKFKQIKKIHEFDITLVTEGEFELIPTINNLNSTEKKVKLNHSINENSKGDPKGFKLIWKITKPEITDICIDSESVSLTTTDLNGKKLNRKISMNELNSSSQSLTYLLKLISLDPNEIYNSFYISKNSSNHYNLKPRTEILNTISQISLKLNSSGFIDNTEITEKNSDTLNIQFYELKETPLKKSHQTSETSC